MNKFLIIGDPHCGKTMSLSKVSGSSRIDDQFKILEWALDKALADDVSTIILTGDVFDEPKPSISLIVRFIDWLELCKINCVNVHIVVGNHDTLRTGLVYTSPLDLINSAELDNVFVYNDISTIFIDSTAITMMPFRDRKSLGCATNKEAVEILSQSLIYELSSIPVTYTKVVVGHLAIEGSIPVGDDIDDITNELFCPISMFAGYDYVWMGHVHSPQVMSKSPYVAHIGSMDISNFSESDHKKITITFNCTTKKWHSDKIPTRQLKKITVSIDKDVEDSTEFVINAIKKANVDSNSIVRVDVSIDSLDSKSINKSSIEKYLIDNGIRSISGIFESKKVELVKKKADSKMSTGMDTSTAIQTYCNEIIDEDDKAPFMELAVDILNRFKAK